MSILSLANVFSCLNQRCPEHLKNKPFPNFSIDTRTIQADTRPEKNVVFVAIKGTQTDGHEYIAEAQKQGAIGVIVLNSYIWTKELLATLSPDFFMISVENTEKALRDLARFYRQQFTIPVIGITGSCGKTTVKEMIGQILEHEGPTLKTKGNYNNEIGVPLTILNLKPEHQFAVIEMGARQIGDIQILSDIVHPTVSVVTLVAPAHIGIFKTMDNIAKAKGEIYQGLAPKGIAIVNRDEPYSHDFIDLCSEKKVVTFGIASGADYGVTDIILNPTTAEFVLHTPTGNTNIKLPMPGLHNVSNALAAASIADSLGIKINKIKMGLENFSTITGRMQINYLESGAIIIDDTYNANPTSLIAAMSVLSHYPGKKILILGDMGELGEQSSQYHVEIGEKAKNLGIHLLFTVGKWSEQTSKAFGTGAIHLENQLAVIHMVKKQLTKECTILVKGSRSAGMEKIVKSLISEGQIEHV